jgi:hypothetical protein
MLRSPTPLALAALLLLAGPASAQSLTVVNDVDWPDFRTHCQELIKGLDTLNAPLPAATVKALSALLVKSPADPDENARAVQRLLDAHCLIGVHINPESRVKAARGARKAELVHKQAAYVLVKVHNDGGVTHPLAVTSEQAVAAGKKGAGRWVSLEVINARPFDKQLSGKRVEYRVMKVTPAQAGKREATLAFDVGQGTQDLGFRAEVPVLFTVRAR